MQVTVLLFAGAREAAGADQVTVPLGSHPTVADLAAALGAQSPTLAPLIARARFAVDNHFAAPADPVPDGAEVALIPPVSGG